MGLEIIQWNCKSILATTNDKEWKSTRYGEMKLMVYIHKPHVLCLGETWLKKTVNKLISEVTKFTEKIEKTAEGAVY